jgi:hypothetical protein
VDRYLAALRREVEAAVDRGDEPGPALEKALRDRVPLVVYTAHEERPGGGEGGGFLREAAEIVFSTGLSLLAREALDTMLDSLDLEAVVEEQLPDA